MRVNVINDILWERQAQDEKWGEQNHDAVWWLAILMEEVGELAQAVMHEAWGGKPTDADNVRQEAVQVAAVAAALVECLDRNGRQSS